MFKFLALISVIALCKAETDFYQMSIDHKHPDEYKANTEQKKYDSDVKDESTGYEKEYKNEEVDRRGYALPQGYGPLKRSESYESESSYSSPYGYERPTFMRKSYQSRDSYDQGYEKPSYSQGYEPQPYVEKSYSSPVSAMRSVQIKPVQSEDYGNKDHTIDVKDDTPIVIHFRTHANRIRVEQTRVPDKPKEVEHTRSEDEPHRVIHEVYKPVIQEIREIIQPYRKVVQQVQPVVEEVQTVVHKADGRRSRGGGEGSNGGEYGGGGGSGGYGSSGNSGYKKSGGSSKKYSTIRDYLPQGSVLSAKGVPVYRSQYKGPAAPKKQKH